MKKFVFIKAMLTMLILPCHAFAHEGIVGETLNATMYVLFGDNKPRTKVVREVVQVPVQTVVPKQETVPQNIVAENVQIVNSTEISAPVQYSAPVTTPVVYPQTTTYVEPSVQYTTPVIYSSPAPIYYGSGYYRTYRPYYGGWYRGRHHHHHHHHHRRCRW